MIKLINKQLIKARKQTAKYLNRSLKHSNIAVFSSALNNATATWNIEGKVGKDPIVAEVFEIIKKLGLRLRVKK